MGLLEALIVIVLLVVSVNVGRLVWQQGRRPKPASYFLTLQTNPTKRPLYGDVIFNFTKSQSAVVYTVKDDVNLGVVILGRVAPAEWSTDDDIRVVARANTETMKTLVPQPAPKEQYLG